MTPPADKSLKTTCYDGHVIVTAWVPGRKWTMPPQCVQAEQHRDSVRIYLRRCAMQRLPAQVF